MHKLWQLALLLVVLCHKIRAADVALSAEGYLEQFNFGKLTQTFHFTATVVGCRWYIHSTPDRGPVAFYVDSFDGQNVYNFFRFNGVPLGANTSGAVIELSDVPSINAVHAIPIWLAYASGCYFSTSGKTGKGRLRPFLSFGSVNISSSDLTEMEWTKSDQAPFLPAKVYHPASNRRFQVLQFTNYQGWFIPCEFSIESLPRNRGIGTNPIFRLHGILSNLTTAVNISDFRPELDAKCYTEDKRFAGRKADLQPSLLYVNTNHEWLSSNAAQAIAMHRSTTPPPARPGVIARFSVWILVGVTSVITFVVIRASFRSEQARG